MKHPIFIVTRVVEERLHTPRLLRAARIPFTLVVDTDEQAAHACQLGYKDVLIAPSNDLASKRNYITEHTSGWYIGMDDNIQEFTGVPDKLWEQPRIDTADTSRNWRKVFNQVCAPRVFVERLSTVIDECTRKQTVYGGVATVENPFFRGRRFSYYHYVKSKIFVMKGGCGVVFKYGPIEDSYASAHAVAKYGCVVVNNYLHYRARWYEPGGWGNRKSREAGGLFDKLDAAISEFPGLICRAKGHNSALRFRLTNEKSVERWRRQQGWIAGRLV